MSTLNDIKSLRKQYPNDQEFGGEVAKYIDSKKACCDLSDNIINIEDNDSHPYGKTVHYKRCKNCGKIWVDKVE